MSEFEASHQKILETEYYQLKQKQSLCDGYKEILEARVRFLLNLLEEIQQVEHRINGVTEEFKGQSGDGGGAGMRFDSPEELCEDLSRAMDKINECEADIEEVISNTTEFLRDNFMICEDIASNLEEVSEDLLRLRGEFDEDSDASCGDPPG